jgi:integrase/recombinase XerD
LIRIYRYHRNDEMRQLSKDRPAANKVTDLSLEPLVSQYLTDLTNANKSAATIRSYASDLGRFASVFPGYSIDVISVEELRLWLTSHGHLSAATRARKQSVVANLFAWAIKHDLLSVNPMLKLDRVKLPAPAPRGVARKQIEAVLAVIPADRLRDKLLFRMVFETGLRANEALGLYVEDLDLTAGDERVTVTGKGNKRRTILLDDDTLVVQLRGYLRTTGYKHGPLFRAEKNGRGGQLRYQSAQELWSKYCLAAGQDITIHQLRHSHATELINEGVSVTTIKRRLGHANIQTTLRYAEQTDQVADKELRDWRRRKRGR